MTRFITLLLALALAACSPMAAIYDPARTATPSATDNPTPTAPAAATEAPKICTVTADALNVRRGPGVSYAVIGYLYAGDIVTIQTQRGAWYEIGAGWIHSKFCEVKP